MLKDLTGIGSVADLGNALLDRLWPDPAERAEAAKRFEQAKQEGKLEELQVAMSAIIMEAKSKDAWTSRARPGFLYVVYTYILCGIPMGLLSVFSPESAVAVAGGTKVWVQAIPGEMWALFGTGYLGYGVMRSKDKGAILQAKKTVGETLSKLF